MKTLFLILAVAAMFSTAAFGVLDTPPCDGSNDRDTVCSYLWSD